MSQWQPIETAPRDGLRVIVYEPDQHFIAISRWWAGAFRVGDLPGIDIYPTHWMPLPAAPE